MPGKKPPSFLRRCRIYFRRFRIAVWCFVLVLVCSVLYLNQVGLPGFLKAPLLQKLRAHGLDLQFSRLRLRWYQGLVAENVRFGRPGEPLVPQLTSKSVELQVNTRALRHFQLQVDGLILRGGKLVWPVQETNQPPRELTVENIDTQLRLLPNDSWALDNFRAGFAGADIRLSGTISNASAVRDWPFLKKQPREGPPRHKDRIRELANFLGRFRFDIPPEVNIDVHGDARDLESFTLRAGLKAPMARTPWARVRGAKFSARLFAADTNGVSQARIWVAADEVRTKWASSTDFDLKINFGSPRGRTNFVNGLLTMSARRADTPWASADHPRATAEWTHSFTNPIPLSGKISAFFDTPVTRWANASQVQLSATLASNTEAPPPQPGWAWWTNLQPYVLEWDARALELRSSNHVAGELFCAGNWRAPSMVITNLHARLYEKDVDATASLNVDTREVHAKLSSRVDPHEIQDMLGAGATRWLSQFTWNAAPQVQAEVAARLPAWTNRHPDWKGEVLPSLRLDGNFELERGGSYRGVAATSAASHFAYSNQTWHLHGLQVARPEGRLTADHIANESTRQFYWMFTSTADLTIARPFLDAKQQKAFDLLVWTEPPAIEGELWGRYHSPEETGFRGKVVLTNFGFRGLAISGLQASLAYTNQVLEAFEPRLQRGTQHVSAAGVKADFRQERVYLTNGFSTADPMFVATAIGPHIARAIEDYQFGRPPTAKVYGTIPLHGEEDADLFIDIAGGPFHWWKFNVSKISSLIHWSGLNLSLTNLHADFYGGDAAGSATFNFHPHQAADFQFSVFLTNSYLQLLMVDLTTKTNDLEGLLSGRIHVTQGFTDDIHSVHGYGNLRLRNGFIWEIPMFGIFTPVLNGMSPGMGFSRATAASATFSITNGVVRSEDLEIRSPPVKLVYRGTIDLDGDLNARVEAELLRDVKVLGPLFSTMLWPVTKMFEYKVTGTLNKPKSEPVYLLNKIVTFPFHPLRTLKGIFQEEPAEPAPPKP